MSAETALASLIDDLEQNRSLEEPRHLPQRIEALDDLEACLPDGPVGQPIATTLLRRAKAIYSRLESLNHSLYKTIRRDIQRGQG